MVRTLLIIAAAGIVLSVITLGGAAVLAGPDIRNGWYIDGSDWSVTTDGDSHGGSHNDGPRIERSLDWSGGDSLVVSLPADVVFTQGTEASVTISGPQSVVDRITLTDGRLDLEDDGRDSWIGWSGDDDRIRIVITAPDVTRFVVEGSGDLDLHGIDVADLIVEIAGSGDIEAVGLAGTLNASVRGSGDADLDDVTVASATLRVEGSGDISARPTESADVQIDGSGDIALRSRPATLNQVVNGSGDVHIGDD